MNGNTVFEIQNMYLSSGYSNFEITTDNFASGSYFIAITSEDYTHTQLLKVLR